MADLEMHVAPGVAIVPEKDRNRGYEKLGAKPGELGINAAGPGHEDNLAAIHELAAAIRGTSRKTGRREA